MEEAQITQICKLWIFAASASIAISSSAQAKRADDGTLLLQRFVEARLAEVGGQSGTAISIYQDSLKRQPDNVLIAGKAYVKAIESGNWSLAIKAIRSIAASGSLEKEMPALLFAEAYGKREWRAAEVALQELDELGNFAFLVPMLRNWLEIEQNSKSKISLSGIKEDRTASYYLDEQNILLLLASGDDDQSIKALREVIEQNSVRMSPIRMIAARHFLAQSRIDTAREILSKGRTAGERRLLEIVNSGKSKTVEQVVSAKTGLAYTFQRLSSDLGSQRAEFLSLVMAQIGSNIIGESDFSQLVVGRAYTANNKGPLARESYQKIEASSPYFLIARNAEIGSYIADQDFESALKRVESEIADKPNLPELHILKGQIFLANGDNKAAAEAYQTGLSFAIERQYSKSLLASYYLALGSAQEQAGLWPEGLRSLEKANELLPNSPNILNYLGYAQLERRENTANALAAIRRAHELRSTSPAITDSLGWAYFIVGDHTKAVSYLEKALAGQPQDPTINEHLGDAYWTVGRKYEARYAWKSAKLFAEGSDVERLLAKIDIGLTPELISP